MNIVILIVVYALILVLASFYWSTDLSRFETARRAKHDRKFSDIDRFRALYPGVLLIARVLVVALLAVFAILSSQDFGALGGWAVLFGAMILAWILSYIFRDLSRRLVDRHLDFFIKYFAWCGALSRTVSVDTETQVASEYELKHVISRSDFLSEEDRRLLLGVASLHERTVSDVMTPRKKIAFVHAKDELTPLFIDELFESGFRMFPVVGKDLDHTIGLLDLDDFREISGRQEIITDKMRKITEPISSDSSLIRALELCAKDHATVLLVSRDDQIVGLVSLSDILRGIFD